MSPEDRIQRALDFAIRYGGTDGDHHKAWVIDQMVRALTGCPTVVETATYSDGRAYSFEKQGESEEYVKLVADAKSGEDGPDSYAWDVGVPP